jgi:hypothetical protein
MENSPASGLKPQVCGLPLKTVVRRARSRAFAAVWEATLHSGSKQKFPDFIICSDAAC